ncbi:MAG TPA: hypothetical protein VMH92_03980 [Acidocella sp.]|nr:hypothetical protein [Acidocella sp.]
MAWILIPLAAFLWRLRGGLLNSITGTANYKIGPLTFNDTTVRIIYSLGLAVAYGVLTAWTWHVAAMAVALFAGCTVWGWFGAALFPTKWRDIGLLSLSGTLRMGFVAAATLSPCPLLAGLLCGPVYWLGSRIPQSPGGWGFWQEWLFGAAIGASLAATIWWQA